MSESNKGKADISSWCVCVCVSLLLTLSVCPSIYIVSPERHTLGCGEMKRNGRERNILKESESEKYIK